MKEEVGSPGALAVEMGPLPVGVLNLSYKALNLIWGPSCTAEAEQLPGGCEALLEITPGQGVDVQRSVKEGSAQKCCLKLNASYLVGNLCLAF